jgi:hypothetical protein
MPLWLVRVKRKVEVVEYGDFTVEADDLAHARWQAENAIEDGEPIDWSGDPQRVKHSPTEIEEIEILANGTEDIKERFD